MELRAYPRSEMSASSAPLTDDAIYFASVPVFFAPVPGQTDPFVASEWHEDASSVPAALARFSLIPDPDGGPPLFHPAIPALDLLRQPSASSESAAQALPQQLRHPLLKVPESLAAPPPNSIQGYASGVRSAVIKLDGHWHCPCSFSHTPHVQVHTLTLHWQVSTKRMRKQQRWLHRQDISTEHRCR